MPGAYDRSRNAAVVRQISANFDSAISIFGTRAPNREAAQGAHDAYVAALRAHGTDVAVLQHWVYPDCWFEDTANGQWKGNHSNMGHPSRKVSRLLLLNIYLQVLKLSICQKALNRWWRCCILHDRYLIGSTRTNREGADFLASHRRRFECEFIDIPSSTLHLTTMCSSAPVDVPQKVTLLHHN